ncbi:C40 family peptidase [Streptomyces sp. Tu102]|uniref:C40 family peptidase n=1 Tax=Streptomyces sp. Tu102 TaxID=2838019 RepID=UPI001BDD32DC|nr:C40 family peptidase [Streptomyces sp. Tu102]MBT1095702.1 C40 family peptidase [Streptomyces sp. Tu102]
MSGRLLRLVCTAAAATAVTLLAPTPTLATPRTLQALPPLQAPEAPTAPAPLSPLEPLAPLQPLEPQERSTADLLTELQQLYRETEQATETYNATAEKLRRQRTEVARLDTALARARLSLHDSRGAAGRLARQQYQNTTDISPYVRLLLAADPQHALDQGHVIGRLARERAETVGRLTGSEREAADLARKAREALDSQLVLAERQKKDRDTVLKQLRRVEELLASLTPAQLAALAQLENEDTAEAQQAFLASGALAQDDQKPSSEGARAIRYAKRQLGKPYKWGAEGPKSYDCSGLTSKAWAHAGTRIPRTSQEQWARLDRVPLTELRPGDLVIYFPDATHVALYVGKGKVVQAPRTGEKVKISPIASNPVLGAVRPQVRPQPPHRDKPRSSPDRRRSSRSQPGR